MPHFITCHQLWGMSYSIQRESYKDIIDQISGLCCCEDRYDVNYECQFIFTAGHKECTSKCDTNIVALSILIYLPIQNCCFSHWLSLKRAQNNQSLWTKMKIWMHRTKFSETKHCHFFFYWKEKYKMCIMKQKVYNNFTWQWETATVCQNSSQQICYYNQYSNTFLQKKTLHQQPLSSLPTNTNMHHVWNIH